MVIQSTKDYKLHTEQIYVYVKSLYGEKRADKFIKHYKAIYDRFGRSFIDYKLGVALMDDRAYCRNIGTRWYAYVGIGGTGKSTLAKNVSYFLDPTFDHSRMTTEIKPLIKTIAKLPFREQKAIFLDEPDDTVHPNSSDGKILRRIFGKIRQQHLHIGICATDLKDIPPYIFRKLDGIFFTPFLGKGIFIKNRPKKKEYLLQEIRFNYDKVGYKIFYQIQNKAGALQFRTHKRTPFDRQSNKYLAEKEADFKKDLKSFVEGKAPVISDRDKLIYNMHKRGRSYSNISKDVGLTKGRVGQIITKINEVKLKSSNV